MDTEINSSGLTLEQKKEYAKILFLKGDLTQKAIAEKLQVSEQAMVDWVQKGQWKEIKKTLLNTKQEQLRVLYDILGGLNKEARIAATDDDPETQPNADAIIKITNAIAKLEKDTGAGEAIDIMIKFLAFMQNTDLKAAQFIEPYTDAFITSLIKDNG